MSVYEIFSNICLKGGAVLLVLMTLVQITPIKISPWSRIAKWLGSTINTDVLKEIESVKKDLKTAQDKIDEVEEKLGEAKAVSSRTRILHFGDEVTHGVRHSKDHFRQILQDITDYDNYCSTHPFFKNNMTKITSERIIEIYKKTEAEDDFL